MCKIHRLVENVGVWIQECIVEENARLQPHNYDHLVTTLAKAGEQGLAFGSDQFLKISFAERWLRKADASGAASAVQSMQRPGISFSFGHNEFMRKPARNATMRQQKYSKMQGRSECKAGFEHQEFVMGGKSEGSAMTE